MQLRWVNLTQLGTPPKPIWVNLDHFAYMAEVENRQATRLYPHVSQSNEGTIDVIEKPEVILAQLEP
jgi:hypothetical protein